MSSSLGRHTLGAGTVKTFRRSPCPPSLTRCVEGALGRVGAEPHSPEQGLSVGLSSAAEGGGLSRGSDAPAECGGEPAAVA